MRFLFDQLLRAATSPWRWFFQRRRLALLLIPFGLAGSRASARDEAVLWMPVASKAADRTRFDLELTLRARRLLVEDPALARFEISVRIDDRIAELSGPVPSMEIAQRAEANLKGLLGLAGIRNRLTIADNSAQKSQSTERARVDWRTPESEPSLGLTTSANSAFAARFDRLPAEPSFSWRPASSHQTGVAFPIPFLPEGLSRPPERREQPYESTNGDRENLRIGKVEFITSPADNRQDADLFVLPAIDLRHGEPKTAPAPSETRPTNRPRYLFIGF